MLMSCQVSLFSLMMVTSRVLARESLVLMGGGFGGAKVIGAKPQSKVPYRGKGKCRPKASICINIILYLYRCMTQPCN